MQRTKAVSPGYLANTQRTCSEQTRYSEHAANKGSESRDSKLLLDATAGGSLLSLSAADATTIIEKMSLSDRQSERSKTQKKPGILELDPSDAVLAQNKLLTNTVEELSKQMSKLMTLQEGSGKAKQVASCELCTEDHPTGHCPPSHEEVNFMANQQRQSQYPNNAGYQRGNNSNYGQGWRQDVGSSNRQRQYESYSQPPVQQTQNSSLEEALRSFIETQTKQNQQQNLMNQQQNQFVQETQVYQRGNDAVLRNLETQIGQIAKEMANNKNQGGSFAANTEPNPKEQCKSITTRSGKEVGKGIGDNLRKEEEVMRRADEEEEGESENEAEKNKKEELVEKEKNEKTEKNEKIAEKGEKEVEVRKEKSGLPQHLPYPHAPSKKDKERQYARFMDIFKRLQINIPFSEALEQMPTYAKFMKEILTKKRKYNDDEVIQLDASCSAIIQRTLPTKEKDPGRVMLPVTIGNVNVGKALIDLGSSINLIPLSVIQRVGGLDITRTRMTLQLADKSITRPSGMAEDVLVKVDKFMFPIDFVVMDIEEDDDVPLILGRPFMKTARMMIDIDDGVMKVRVQDEEVSFNLWEAMKHPHEKDMCFKLDATEEAILDVRKQAHRPSSLEQALTDAFEALDPEKEEEIEDFLKQLDTFEELPQPEVEIDELKKDGKPVEVKLELKTLPSHLKYVFLGDDNQKPVIISSSLSKGEEESLIQVLKNNKEAIGWALSDLKGEPFSFTTMVRGKTIRFDRNAINEYLGNPFTLPAHETLCDFQKQRARKTWDIDTMRRKLLRPNHDFVYGTTNRPLRALRDDMRTFTLLLFLLVLYNIQPNSHTSDAVMNILGLIHYINEGLEVDLAGIISGWMKEITLCGHPDKNLKSTAVRSDSPLGFPCLIMGLCTANRIHIPEIGREEIGKIDDDYVDRYCKPKKRRAAQQPPPPPPPQASTSAVHDQNFYNHFTYLYDQNDAGYRAMSAMQQSFYNQHTGQSVMTPQDFQAYVAWPEVRPTFLGGGNVADAEAANEGDNASEGEAGSDASMQEGDESDAGSESGSEAGSESE
ncbi:unnamed protein product [Trifolium pratense]|uniref:Uncharacterized protein n=1 Tax=Trifolium pratense TaxID=57577 RepID=A0ACB0JLZ9_TRIPR|nr:unnamed protein product [Trifolium pratense]